MKRPTTGLLKDFGVRTASAAILGLVILAALFLGGVWWLAGLIALIGALATSELYGLARRERRLPNDGLGITAVVVMPFAAAAYGLAGLAAVASALLASTLVSHVLFRQARLSDSAITAFGALYVGYSLSHAVLIRHLEDGMLLLLTMIVGIWVNDVFAYLAGSTVGKHSLAPRISPAKTWEGLVAGSLATTIVWVAAGPVLGLDLDTPRLLAIGIVLSMAAVTGDLAESRMKREASVKDSGTLMPGHGGMLDRFDSFILVGLVCYYALLVAGIR